MATRKQKLRQKNRHQRDVKPSVHKPSPSKSARGPNADSSSPFPRKRGIW